MFENCIRRYSSHLLIPLLMAFISLPALDTLAKESNFENASISSEKAGSPSNEVASEKSTDSLEEELDETSTESLEEEIAKNPLIPPNASSPRATLMGFIENMNLAHSVLMEAHDLNHQTPGLLTSSGVQREVKKAEEFIKRSIHYLDLSKIPDEFLEKVGIERALMLKEVLDRVELPPFIEIPGVKAIEKEEEEEKIAELDQWRLPHTDIVVGEMVEGSRKGQYLFTAQTVDRLEEFYNKVRHLPYKENEEVSRNFYDFYISTPGSLLPPKWYGWLPLWSTNLVFGQAIWQWCALFIIPVFSLILIWLLVRMWFTKSVEFSTGIKILGWVLIVAINVVAALTVNHTLNAYVNISGSILVVVGSVLKKSFIIILLVMVLWEALRTSIKKQAQEETNDDDDDEWGARGLSRGDTLLLILRKFIVIIVLTILVFLLLSAIGINIGPLLAGAGVIGIAVGFGSQKLVADVLSGIFFLVDDAFRVGEYIEAGSVSGTVEAVTLRNVMLRHHRGMLQIVPYSELVTITNYMRGGLIVKFNIELPYDTDIEKVRKIIKKVGKQMLEDPEIGPDFIRPVKSQGVRSVGDSVMVIRIKFTAQPGKHFLIRREAFRRITEALADRGIYYAHRKVIVEMPETDPEESTVESEKDHSVQRLAGAAASLETIVNKENQPTSQNNKETS